MSHLPLGSSMELFLLGDMAGGSCLQTEWHLRQVLNDLVTQGTSR